MTTNPRYLKAMFDVKQFEGHNKSTRRRVSGYTVNLYGYKLGVWKDTGYWALTDLETGMRLSGYKDTRNAAVSWFEGSVVDAYERTRKTQYYADLVHEFEQMPVQPVKIKL